MTNQELDDIAERFAHIKKGAPFVLSTHRFNCLTADREVSLVGTCDRAATLVDDARLLNELVAILQNHSGETGESESAVETLQRIIRERDEYRATHRPSPDPYADWAFHPTHVAAIAEALGLPAPVLMDEEGNPL